ncbi:MAG: hypothetical protein FDZ70_05325 [Actinobacteria bacterium]|nr:MAG: hypothetical protein FDZ70_05325 [Actinomycetota bacterium]
MKMKRTLYVLVAMAALAALAAGCSGGGCAKAESPGGWDTKPAADFKSWMDATLGGAPWYAKVTTVDQTTRLGVPVVYVRTSMANAERDVALSDIMARASTATAAPFDGILYIFGEQDMPVSASLGSVPAASELPAAPAKAEEMASWLESAYGSTKEPWLAHVTGSRADAQRGAVVVTTDLDFASTDDRWLGATVLEAMRSSKQAFASQIVVLYADGSNENSSPM